MNGHPQQWLQAYHDGELSGRRLRDVETHLETCPACRAELAQLGTLHALLLQAPAPPAPTSPARFQAQVGLRLPSRVAQPAAPRAFRWAARLIPAALLIIMPLTQVLWLLASGIYLLSGTELGQALGLLWLAPYSLNGAPAITGPAMVLQATLEYTDVVFWCSIIPLGILAIGMLMGIAWLAGMWMSYRQAQFARNGAPA